MHGNAHAINENETWNTWKLGISIHKFSDIPKIIREYEGNAVDAIETNPKYTYSTRFIEKQAV